MSCVKREYGSSIVPPFSALKRVRGSALRNIDEEWLEVVQVQAFGGRSGGGSVRNWISAVGEKLLLRCPAFLNDPIPRRRHLLCV